MAEDHARQALSDRRRVRTGRRLAVLLAVAAVTLGLAAPAAADTADAPAHPAAVQRASTHHATATLATHYARIEPLCHDAEPGAAACQALRRVDVPAGTAGAVAYPAVTGAHGPHQGYSPADLARVYKMIPSMNTHAVVAVVVAYNAPHIVRELDHFDRHYGLPPENRNTFVKLDQAGGKALPRTDWGWAGEAALDVEAVRAMCNKCKIMLIEARNAKVKNLARAENTAARLGADVISNSYGAPEAGTTRSVKLAYRHPGVVITAATGDDGWYDWDFVNTTDSHGNQGTSDNMPNAPASLPSVVAVGGTTLNLNADGTRAAETVWNGNGEDNKGDYIGASGGGCSTVFAAPAWQLAVAGYADTGCGRKRLAGDVSAVADPSSGFSVYAPNPDKPATDSWQVFGGTSLATPLVAGMYGLAGGSGGVRYPGQSLYLNYRYHHGWAHDVRTGGNSFCGGDSTTSCASAVRFATLFATANPNNLSDGQGNWLGLLDCSFAYDGSQQTRPANTQCNAAPGYDGPSGVGTPNGVRLFRSAQPSVHLGHAVRVRAGVAQIYGAVHFVDTIGHAVRYAFHWGDGTAPTLSTHPLVKHRFARPGTYTVHVTVFDNLGRRAVDGAVLHAR